MSDLAYTITVAVVVVTLWWAGVWFTKPDTAPRRPHRKQPLGKAGPKPPPNGRRVATKPEGDDVAAAIRDASTEKAQHTLRPRRKENTSECQPT